MVSLLIDKNFIFVRECIESTFHQHPKIPQFWDAEITKWFWSQLDSAKYMPILIH
jgi:hypothetical protein